MNCYRCDGLIVADGDEIVCKMCGCRSFPGHPVSFISEEPCDADDKRIRSEKTKTTIEIREKIKVRKPGSGRPPKVPIAVRLKGEPQSCPLEEHPYVLWLAKCWEDLDERIELLKKEQEELKTACDDFKETYKKHSGDSGD